MTCLDDILADIDAEPIQPEPAGQHPGRAWKRLASDLPPAVRRMLETIRIPGLRLAALRRAERYVLSGSVREDLDAARYRALWRSAWSNRNAETTRAIRLAIDQTLKDVHIARMVEHEAPYCVPTEVRTARVRDGKLTVEDPPSAKPSFGVRSYPERTPPEVVTVAARTWRSRVRHPRPPLAWDLTAGSGTVQDVLRCNGGRVVSTDLTNNGNGVAKLDARNLGCCPGHGQPVQTGHFEGLVVQHPDMVFLDPPSRGVPTMAELDRSDDADRDLASLDRNVYIEIVATIVSKSVERLAAGGLVSLLVREGVRNHQHITQDSGVADAIMGALAAGIQVVGHHEVVYAHAANQVSVGSARCPMVHLLLGRRATCR